MQRRGVEAFGAVGLMLLVSGPARTGRQRFGVARAAPGRWGPRRRWPRIGCRIGRRCFGAVRAAPGCWGYERGSIIVTSNRGFEAWGEILGDAMVAAALIDRLVRDHWNNYILHHSAVGVSEGVRWSDPEEAPVLRLGPTCDWGSASLWAACWCYALLVLATLRRLSPERVDAYRAFSEERAYRSHHRHPRDGQGRRP
jgi:hypothetical protein